MTNAELEVNGDILTITVDMSKSGGISKSGKSNIIATSGGNKPVPGHADAKIGLNIYTPRY
jgi:hypothetical protein